MKLILFDLDGVLVDACEWHYNALNKALFALGHQEISRNDHISKYNGLPTKVKLKALGLGEEDIIAVEATKQRFTLWEIQQKCYPDVGKISMLIHLKKLGHKIGCVTNSIKETATLMLELTGQLPYMDVFITNEDVVEAKPSPEGYLVAINRAGFGDKLEDVTIVEDSEKGIQAAMAANPGRIVKVASPSEVNFNLICRL